MPPEPPIHREEVLLIMGMLGDIRAELEKIARLLGWDDEEEAEADS
jgi:hypothetical protein